MATTTSAPKSAEVRVPIYLPMLEGDGSGAAIDQTEHVTINGRTTLIQRGEAVEVTVPVFMALKVKYPNL